MIFKILGIKAVQGTSKKSGKPFDAYILHAVRDNPNDVELEGMEVKQMFIDKRLLLKDVQAYGTYKGFVGHDVEINYDDGGFVESARMIAEKK